uniref:Secreted protein n=1 Tax=Heterorhabditis bacteriophora TaxID=37862 RepID=A0A1I7WR76_HETBA
MNVRMFTMSFITLHSFSRHSSIFPLTGRNSNPPGTHRTKLSASKALLRTFVIINFAGFRNNRIIAITSEENLYKVKRKENNSTIAYFSSFSLYCLTSSVGACCFLTRPVLGKHQLFCLFIPKYDMS